MWIIFWFTKRFFEFFNFRKKRNLSWVYVFNLFCCLKYIFMILLKSRETEKEEILFPVMGCAHQLTIFLLLLLVFLIFLFLFFIYDNFHVFSIIMNDCQNFKLLIIYKWQLWIPPSFSIILPVVNVKVSITDLHRNLPCSNPSHCQAEWLWSKVGSLYLHDPI